jgi:predicted nuclease of predicted toxin-antitoxin system
MRLYLDDVASPLLARLLAVAGHDVQSPIDAAMVGAEDAVHLAHAVRNDRVSLTRNYDDFQDLHDLIGAVHGHHPGILVVRLDNDPRRDLTARGIVRCLRNLEAANVPVADQYIILNQWR